MKKTILYAIVVIVILAIVVLGWYYFSSQAAFKYAGACPKWLCKDTKMYTCPNSTTNYSCSNGFLTCYICSTNYTIKSYNVSLTAVAYQNVNNTTVLAGIYNINEETTTLNAGQRKTLMDGTIFGVTILYLNYSAFYLQSQYETKSSSLIAPFPKSTTFNLIVSQSQGCGVVTNSCPSGYTPSCSGSTLTCQMPAKYLCSYDKPFADCTKTTSSCRPCPV